MRLPNEFLPNADERNPVFMNAGLTKAALNPKPLVSSKPKNNNLLTNKNKLAKRHSSTALAKILAKFIITINPPCSIIVLYLTREETSRIILV
jgi:hypothetical protein